MKKGFTLIEVLVALAIFMISFASILGCYLLGINAYHKQEEYLYFETICLDIDKVYDNSNIDDWQSEYFNSKANIYYYDASYNLVNNEDKYSLIVNVESNELIISIYNNYSNYYVIENLNYGSRSQS